MGKAIEKQSEKDERPVESLLLFESKGHYMTYSVRVPVLVTFCLNMFDLLKTSSPVNGKHVRLS